MSTADRRYYWQRNRATGFYQVKDRYLSSESITTCNYREQAILVTDALNLLHQSNQTKAATFNVRNTTIESTKHILGDK